MGTVTVEASITRKSGDFPAPRLVFGEVCDQGRGETGQSSAFLYTDTTDDGTNLIRFVAECPPIALTGLVAEQSGFLINSESDAAVNIDVVSSTLQPWNSSERMAGP